MVQTPRRVPEKKLRSEPLFYIAVLAVLASVYGWVVYASAELRGSFGLALFTALMALHAVLHLVIPQLRQRRRWLTPYFVAQVALVWVINTIAVQSGTGHGQYLYLVMAVEVIALFSQVNRWVIVLVTAYLLIGLINFVWLWGWQAVPAFLGQAVPQTVFTIAFTVLFFRQLNARRHMQSLLLQLEVAHQQLSTSAAQIEDLTLATERQRLARELHDTLAQGVAGLTLQLEAVDKHLTRGNIERARTIVQQAMLQARKTLTASREAINDLRSTDDFSKDFAEQLRTEIGCFQNETGLACTLNLDVPVDVPKALHQHALRVVTEGLLNIARHANASHADVHMRNDGAGLEITIQDDGLGFEMAQPVGEGHYGLLGLRERAQLMGGKLQIDSTIGRGTVLHLHVPSLPPIRMEANDVA